MGDLQYDLNRLAGTIGLEETGAANAWAGTSGYELVGALNVKNGTVGLELNAVVKALATTYGGNPALDWNQALATAAGGGLLTEGGDGLTTESDEPLVF